MSPAALFLFAWVAWGLSWLAAAAWTGRTESAVSSTRGDVWLYRGLVLLGFVLLNHRVGRALAAERLWHVGVGGGYALASAAIVALLFTWWARIGLGRLWSGAVTKKEGHRVVDAGPYAIVRHPIYTGIIAATLATAVALATWPALLAVVCVGAGLWLKASIEERFLATAMAGDAYASYRRRVPMLIPFWRPGK